MKRRDFLRTSIETLAAGTILPALPILPIHGITPALAATDVANTAASGAAGALAASGTAAAAGATADTAHAAALADTTHATGADAAGAAAGTPGIPLLAVAHGLNIASVTRASIDALGGMKRFVHRHDRVVIKANIGWDRTPEQAATTNPEVVATLVRLALQAGAKSVLVLDNPCNDPRRSYLRSGIADAVRAAGGKVDFFEEARTKKMAIGGQKLHEWLVHPAFVEADVRINVPIAKHHALSGATLGMKNWLGAIGGPRNQLHPEIGASIVDLAAFFRPSLTVIDGIRILTHGGPQGGSLDDVVKLDTVIASADPVAAEARGALLLGPKIGKLPHIALAASRGLGRATWSDSEERRIEVS